MAGRAVIFDLDGTLIDSMWVWADIDIHYLGDFGLSVPDDLKTTIEGMSFRETAKYFKKRFAIPDPVERIQETWNRMAYDRYRSRVKLKPYAFDFLRHLKDKGVALGIATSNSRMLSEMVLASNGVLDFFSEIRTGEDVKEGKPNPEIYLGVSSGLGVDPGDCIVFEDVAMGVQAGKNAGMKVCGIYDEWNKAQEPEVRRLADHFFYGYEELAAMPAVEELLAR